MREILRLCADVQPHLLQEHEKLALALQAALDREAAMKADYEVAAASARRLAREIDVAMHGEEGAAQQASLCDLVDPARWLRERAEAAEASNRALVEARHNEREALRACLWHLGTEEDRKHMAEYGYGWRFGSRVLKEQAADMARTALAAALTALQAGEEAK